jgi:hypothetical protein
LWLHCPFSSALAVSFHETLFADPKAVIVPEEPRSIYCFYNTFANANTSIHHSLGGQHGEFFFSTFID